MSDLNTLLKLWDTAAWEFSLAFEGLEDAYLWRTPHPNLPSIGIQACHLARSESTSFGSSVESPLIVLTTGYYPYGSGDNLPIHLTAEEVLAEYDKVHKAAVAWIRDQNIQLGDPYPDPAFAAHEGMTWGDRIEYMPFHVAYHTGQAYMTRHIFGHETTDN